MNIHKLYANSLGFESLEDLKFPTITNVLNAVDTILKEYLRDLCFDLLKENIDKATLFNFFAWIDKNDSGNVENGIQLGERCSMFFSFNWSIINGTFLPEPTELKFFLHDGSEIDLIEDDEIISFLENHFFEEQLKREYENTCNVCDVNIKQGNIICNSRACIEADGM